MCLPLFFYKICIFIKQLHLTILNDICYICYATGEERKSKTDSLLFVR